MRQDRSRRFAPSCTLGIPLRGKAEKGGVGRSEGLLRAERHCIVNAGKAGHHLRVSVLFVHNRTNRRAAPRLLEVRSAPAENLRQALWIEGGIPRGGQQIIACLRLCAPGSAGCGNAPERSSCQTVKLA